MPNVTSNWTLPDGNISCLENRTVLIACAVVFVFTFISSVVGNTLVIGAIVKFKRLRKRNVNFLIGSLAFSNLLIAGLSPFEIFRVFYPETSRKLVCCLVYFAVVVSLMNTAGGNFVIISFERFIAVMFPLRHRTLLTRKRLKMLIFSVWMFSSVFACLPLFGWNKSARIELTTELHTCSIDVILPLIFQEILVGFGGTYVITNCILFIPVIMVAYKTSINSGTQPHSSNGAGLTKLLAYTFATFCISWCPFHIATIVVLLYEGPLIQCAHQWTMHVGYLHSAFDWMIYGLGNRSFRKAFKQIIFRRNSGRRRLNT